MDTRHFSTNEFAVTDSGIELLARRDVIESISFEAMDEIIVDRGRQTKYPVRTGIFGTLLLAFGLIWICYLVLLLISPSIVNVKVEYFVVPLIPLILGGLCLYYVFKMDYVLRIIVKGKEEYFPLGQLRAKGEIGKLIWFFHSNELTQKKLKVTFDPPPKTGH